MNTVERILAKKGANVASVGEFDSALDAARLMRERRIGSVVVVRDGDVIGIFTERDIVNRVVAAGRDPQTTRVEEVMTTPVACCNPETTLDECASVFTQKRLRHLPVVKDGKLCGIITSGDILASQVKECEQTIVFLQEYMHGPQT